MTIFARPLLPLPRPGRRKARFWHRSPLPGKRSIVTALPLIIKNVKTHVYDFPGPPQPRTSAELMRITELEEQTCCEMLKTLNPKHLNT